MSALKGIQFSIRRRERHMFGDYLADRHVERFHSRFDGHDDDTRV